MLVKLRSYRKSQRMTQQQLAEQMETTRRSVIRWENGQSTPSLRKRRRLAEVLGCRWEDFCDSSECASDPSK